MRAVLLLVVGLVLAGCGGSLPWASTSSSSGGAPTPHAGTYTGTLDEVYVIGGDTVTTGPMDARMTVEESGDTLTLVAPCPLAFDFDADAGTPDIDVFSLTRPVSCGDGGVQRRTERGAMRIGKFIPGPDRQYMTMETHGSEGGSTVDSTFLGSR